ncbi:hypothetical protein [Cupriavidus sp. 2MCAB6]|uniref:hypothetical protein n=1 Tax=Cupriavidus sp. 2MCAB6 TaxID=3232981 RepID=UPI003F908DFA
MDGAEVFSFTMLTINSDKHPLMNRFHAPGKEKRMIVILPRAEWDNWLTCRDPERARSFMRPHAHRGPKPPNSLAHPIERVMFSRT